MWFPSSYSCTLPTKSWLYSIKLCTDHGASRVFSCLLAHKQLEGANKEPNPGYAFLIASDQENEGKQGPSTDSRLIKRTVSLTYPRGRP